MKYSLIARKMLIMGCLSYSHESFSIDYHSPNICEQISFTYNVLTDIDTTTIWGTESKLGGPIPPDFIQKLYNDNKCNNVDKISKQTLCYNYSRHFDIPISNTSENDNSSSEARNSTIWIDNDCASVYKKDSYIDGSQLTSYFPGKTVYHFFNDENDSFNFTSMLPGNDLLSIDVCDANGWCGNESQFRYWDSTGTYSTPDFSIMPLAQTQAAIAEIDKKMADAKAAADAAAKAAADATAQAQVVADTNTCVKYVSDYSIIPYLSWGRATESVKRAYSTIGDICNQYALKAEAKAANPLANMKVIDDIVKCVTTSRKYGWIPYVTWGSLPENEINDISNNIGDSCNTYILNNAKQINDNRFCFGSQSIFSLGLYKLSSGALIINPNAPYAAQDYGNRVCIPLIVK